MNLSMMGSGAGGLGSVVLGAAIAGLAAWAYRRRDRKGPMFTKRAAYLFLVFLLVVVAAADAGVLPPELRVLYDYPNGDRLGHLGIFGILAFLFSAAFGGLLRVRRWAVPVAVVALLAFATAEEVSQRWFPSRHFDPVDLVCSYLGIALGGWAGVRWRKRVARAERAGWFVKTPEASLTAGSPISHENHHS